MTSITKTGTQEYHQTILAQYLPNGKLFEAKVVPGTVMYKLLFGLAAEIKRAADTLCELEDQHFPETTDAFITEWETALGIPDDCFPGTGEPTERRLHILLKLIYMQASTVEDFVKISQLLGFDIEIIPGVEYKGFVFDFPFSFSSAKEARFTMYVKLLATNQPSVFQTTFPITFTKPANQLLQCIIDKIKPANVLVIYEYS